jgi:hypothetical protein
VLRRVSGESPAEPARGWGGLGEGRVDGQCVSMEGRLSGGNEVQE